MTPAKITTTFFLCKYGWGRPEASDDICELRWADVGSLFCSKDEKVPDDPTDGWIEIVPEHLPLMKAFQQKMVTRRDAKYANRNIKESLRELHFCKPFDIGVGETLGKKAEWLARYANVDISLEYGNKDVVVYSGDAGVQYPIGASVSDVLHALAAQTEHKLIIADHKVYFVSGVAPKNAKNSKMKIEKGDVK